MLHVTVLGCGEVGRCYATALGATGHFAIELCDTVPGAKAHELARNLGTLLHTQVGSWLHETDLVISCVIGGAALAAARQCLAHLPAGSIFADFTTASPEDKIQAAGEARNAGIRYVDTVILGAISVTQQATPLLCVGEGAEVVVDTMRKVGAPIRVLQDGAVGDAAALKLLRTIFTKGLEALAVETLVAAERRGLLSQLHEVLSDFDKTPLRTRLDTLVRTHVVHAERRLHEVAEAEHQVTKSGLEPKVLPGVKALFEETCEAKRKSPPGTPANAAEALAWLSRIRQSAPVTGANVAR